MANTFNKDLAAAVLLEAVYSTDDKACAKYGITRRTLSNHRTRLETDANFSHYFATKKKIFDEAWAEEMPIALRKALRFIGDAVEKADPRNPMVIESIVGAIKIIAEVQMTGKLIDARITQADRPQDSIPGQGDSSAEIANTYRN